MIGFMQLNGYRVWRQYAACVVISAGLVTACGGDDEDPETSAATTAPAQPAATTADSFPPLTAGTVENAGRLTCSGGVRTFEALAPPVGSSFEVFDSADEAVAAEVAENPEAESAAVVGAEERGTRYVLYDADGTAVSEVVVGDSPEGLRIILFDSCA